MNIFHENCVFSLSVTDIGFSLAQNEMYKEYITI